MTAKQLTVTVALDTRARERLKKAAKVQGQSLTAFVEGAAAELARRRGRMGWTPVSVNRIAVLVDGS